MPTTEHDWLEIASGYFEKWQFPHCLGAIDGKHIVMRSPDNSGSVYFNYKGTFSIVLLALADAHLQFVMIGVGAYGRNSDGGIFAHSNFGKALNTNALCLPSGSHLPGAKQLGDVPFVFIGDEAFPLHEHIMRPYPGRGCTDEQRVFNYRLSRARRCVESAFGVLATRWRVFYTKNWRNTWNDQRNRQSNCCSAQPSPEGDNCNTNSEYATRLQCASSRGCRGPAKNRCAWVTASSRYSGHL